MPSIEVLRNGDSTQVSFLLVDRNFAEMGETGTHSARYETRSRWGSAGYTSRCPADVLEFENAYTV